METTTETAKNLVQAAGGPISYLVSVILKNRSHRKEAVTLLLGEPKAERDVIRLSLQQTLDRLRQDADRLQAFLDQTADRPRAH